MELPHHLLLTGTLLPTFLEFTHIFPITFTLLLLGVDPTGIEGGAGRCGEEGGSSNRGDDECLCVCRVKNA